MYRDCTTHVVIFPHIHRRNRFIGGKHFSDDEEAKETAETNDM